MTDWGRVIRCAAVGVGAAALLAGCNNGGDGTSSASSSAPFATSTITPSAPTSFNGCQLPQSVISAEQFDPDPTNADAAANGGIKFKGCVWSTHEGDGYNVNVWSTNMTVQMVDKMSDYKVADHPTIGGRQAVTFHTSDETDLRASCMINVEIKGGGLDLLVDNPASHKATGTLDSCEIAKKLATELVATLPASA